jgi:hypothetical protein
MHSFMLLDFGDFQRGMHRPLYMTDMVDREDFSVSYGRFYAYGELL